MTPVRPRNPAILDSLAAMVQKPQLRNAHLVIDGTGVRQTFRLLPGDATQIFLYSQATFCSLNVLDGYSTLFTISKE